MKPPIYLDYNATTPVAPEVADAMDHATRKVWGNPSSAHAYGRPARTAVEAAREQVASLIGARPSEIVMTSGGTESDNAAILGVAEATRARGRHLVISAVEHPAVDRPAEQLASRGWTVDRVPVDREGRVDAGAFAAKVRDDTALISLMHANNETGVIQPVRDVSDRVRPRGVVIHSDTAQSIGKIPVDVDDLGVDLLTIAGHKLYGPKGIGALYLRDGTPFEPFLRGAGHERGLRSGTEPVAEIVGLGVACELAARQLADRAAHLARVRDRLEARLHEAFPGMVVHGAGADRLPNTAYVALPGVDAADLVRRADGVALAAGAACHSGKTELSRVLKAMRVDPSLAGGTLRLTVGSPTTEADVDEAVRRIVAAIRR